MLRETGGGHSVEMIDGTEEEVDIEGVITELENRYGDFISSDNEDQFNEFFDAVRRTYSDPETKKDWDILFEDFKTALDSTDEDDLPTVVRNYVKKGNTLG